MDFKRDTVRHHESIYTNYDKELYNDEFVFLTCDRWIDDCLKRFDCSKYVFVVDTTE